MLANRKMRKRHVQTVHTQKGNTNGPHTYKKMVSLTDSEKKKIIESIFTDQIGNTLTV